MTSYSGWREKAGTSWPLDYILIVFNIFYHGGHNNFFTLEWIFILGMDLPFFTCYASHAMLTTELLKKKRNKQTKKSPLRYVTSYSIVSEQVSHLIAENIPHYW